MTMTCFDAFVVTTRGYPRECEDLISVHADAYRPNHISDPSFHWCFPLPSDSSHHSSGIAEATPHHLARLAVAAVVVAVAAAAATRIVLWHSSK